MSEIRTRDDLLDIVNRLMICAMEDIDLGRNEASLTTLDLVKRIEDHDAALRADRDAWRAQCVAVLKERDEMAKRAADTFAEAVNLRERLDQFEAYDLTVASALDWKARAEAAESRLAEAEETGMAKP